MDNQFYRLYCGFAILEVLRDSRGEAVDCEFKAVNTAFEELMGLTAGEVAGRKLTDIVPEINAEWIHFCGRIASGNLRAKFRTFFPRVGKRLEFVLYSHAEGQVGALITDITLRLKTQAELPTKRGRVSLDRRERPGRHLHLARLRWAVPLRQRLRQRVDGILHRRTAADRPGATGAVGRISPHQATHGAAPERREGAGDLSNQPLAQGWAGHAGRSHGVEGRVAGAPGRLNHDERRIAIRPQGGGT